MVSKRRKISFAVILSGVALIVAVMCSLKMAGPVSALDDAVSSSAIDTYTKNGLFKVFYSNLDKCYTQMQSSISEGNGGVWARFDTATYFTSTGLDSNYLKFPYALGTSGKYTASCPGLIVGWNGWWSNKYAGLVGTVKKDAPVPNETYYGDSSAMGTFLENIGYTKTTDTTTLGGLKCFYYEIKVNSGIYNIKDLNWQNLSPPSNGKNFETLDFCIREEDGYVSRSSGITYYYGTKGYTQDEGHITGDSNRMYIHFSEGGLAPIFTDYTMISGGWSGIPVLQANIEGISLDYDTVDSSITYVSTQNVSSKVDGNTVKNDGASTLCSYLGYQWCNYVSWGLWTYWVGSFTNPFSNPEANITYSNFKSYLRNVLVKLHDTDGVLLFDSVTTKEYSPGEKKYTKGASSSKFIQYFIGSTSQYNSGKFSDAEAYMLYYNYLKGYYGAAFSESSASGGVYVSWLQDDGTFKKGYVYVPSGSSTKNDRMYMLVNNKWTGTKDGSWEDIANELKAIDIEAAFNTTDGQDPDSVVDPGLDDPDLGEPGQPAEDPCYNAGASLGWIVCPVLDIAGKALVGIYDMVIQPFLEIKSQWLGTGSDSVYSGWKQFRDIANVVFAIAFAVVILAQVTGIGISNYNIKKILPRLIMVVVLVNLSYVICQLVVDISNIVGAGLQNLFVGMANRVGAPPGVADVEIYGGDGTKASWFSLGGVVSTGLTIVLAGAAIWGLVVSWELWLIPFLLAVLGCLVGVIFFFIILGVRQAGVLILTALAPVAIVCYALPNTKSFFDRWLKMYQGLLLVYPICGALIGGGQFASALLIAAGGGSNFFYDLVAMLVQVVPFFMIPSILKSSMAAMGNLGMKISSFGQRLGSGATRAIGNSEGVREARRSLDMRNAERSFNRLNKRAAKLEQSGRKLSRRQMRARGNAAARYNRLAYEDFRAGGRRELLQDGSNLWERESAKQFEEDVVGKQELLRSGKIGSVVNDGETVNGNDDAALEAELGTYIDKIIAGTGTTQEQDNYVKSAQAIANTLSDRGTGSARARVVNSLASAINRNQSTLTAAMGTSDAAKANRQRLGSTLGSVFGRLNSKYGKAYKGDNPEAIKMFNDVAQADFSRAGSFTRTVQDRDIDGNVTGTHLRSTQYAGAGLDGMNEEDFSKLKTSGLSNILDGIQTGDIKGARLQEAARLADRVLNSDVYTPDADARRYMEQIRDAAFASTHSGSGASAIKSASSSAIDSIVSRLQASGAWSSLTTTQQTELSGLASNVKTALETGTFTSGDAQQLQQALKIAHNNGIEVGGSVISDTPSTPPTLKIDRNTSAPAPTPTPAPAATASSTDTFRTTLSEIPPDGVSEQAREHTRNTEWTRDEGSGLIVPKH